VRTQLPTLVVVIIYLLAALVPALFLMRYIYRKDTIEKEPKGMLVGLVFLGVAAAVVAVILETLGLSLLSRFLEEGDPAHTIVMAFLVVAVVEEGVKFLFLLWRTWRDPNFNFRFDGIVYAVFVSLGFAAFENISYLMGYGWTTALARALLAIPRTWALPCSWAISTRGPSAAMMKATRAAGAETSGLRFSSRCCCTGFTTPARY